MIMAAVCVCVPIAAYNYMKHEVEIGNFGYEEETADGINSKVQMPYSNVEGGESPIQDLEDTEDFDEIVPPPPSKEELQRAK